MDNLISGTIQVRYAKTAADPNKWVVYLRRGVDTFTIAVFSDGNLPAEKRAEVLAHTLVLAIGDNAECLNEHDGPIPENGVDRCPCGCKYWRYRECIDCREQYDPRTAT